MKIIYKFTIVALLQRDGHKPFYVGQHIERRGNPIKSFMRQSAGNYIGSGEIWLEYIANLKKLRPNNWYKFIKREILYSSTDITQRGLDALEAYYIKKEKSHYSLMLGGTNVLWGTANKFGSGNPMNDEKVIEKVRQKKKGKYGGKNCYWYGKKLSDETKRIISEKVREYYKHNNPPNWGQKMSEQSRQKMRNAAKKRAKETYAHGFHRSKEERERIRQGVLKFYQNGGKSGFACKKHTEESKNKQKQRYLKKKS